jgi:hypothetical protein
MKVAAAALTAAFAVVTTVAVKSFRALLDLGEEFNNVTRTIRVGTGAIGGDLAALEQSFRNVATSAPNAFADIATVIAELDTRTDLAGEGLETMANQLLTLSRLMGGDAQATTRSVTRLLNNFGVEAEDSADVLDLLFRAAQASGSSVDGLAESVRTNASDLRSLGLGLEEQIGLLALFEREGIRGETVVRALRSGFRRLTEDGKPLQEALADVFEELQSLDREAAVTRGLEIFGNQAGTLVDALLDGKLSMDDFTAAIVDGEDTILGVAEETDGWRVKLDELKNYLKIQFEPLAREVFNNVTEFVDQLRPAAERVAKAFEEDGLEGALAQIAEEWDEIYENQIKPLFARFLVFLDEVIKPAALDLGKTIGAAIASGMWSAFKSGVSNLFGPELGKRVLEGTGGLDDFELSRSPLSQDLRDLGNLGLPSMGGTGGSIGAVRGGAQQAGIIATTDISGLAEQLANLPRMASGGIVTSPTLALIGEAGPEAVVPLSQGGMMGGNVYVTVTSADPEAVVEAIRRYTRANGPLGQVVNV